tara:strand:- start:350 stop:1381 length:1032 start_codon:yes stop_codon:yes gene_type:complete
MTIAFSTKSLDWKTQYSFEPVHYSNTKTDLISFNRSESNAGVWVHDSSSSYNNFYGTQYPSKLSVITNNNPSATKIYEAFSVESTSGSWKVDFETRTGDTQKSSINSNSLVTKEGKHYIDIPKDTLNKQMTYTYVGKTTVGDLFNASQPGYMKNKIKVSGKVHTVPSQLGILFKSFSVADLYDFGLDNESASAYQSISISDEVSRYVPGLTSSTVVSYTDSETQLEFTDGFESRYEYDSYTNSIMYINDNFPEVNNVADFYYSGLVSYFGEELELVDNNGRLLLEKAPVYLYSITPVGVNGEDMRGEFMRLDLERSGSDYYELFAINIDQHQTKLDHSLGQNN